MTAIYGLYDPRTDTLRYVGKTVRRLSRRLQDHISDAKVNKHHNRRLNWIRNLLFSGIQPGIFLIEETENWQAAERQWISRFRNLGADLVNGNDGGDGSSGISGETAHKISQATKKRIAAMTSDEKDSWRRKLSVSLKGRKKSPEWQAKITAALQGHVVTDEQRRDISLAMTGKAKSPKSIEKRTLTRRKNRSTKARSMYEVGEKNA